MKSRRIGWTLTVVGLALLLAAGFLSLSPSPTVGSPAVIEEALQEDPPPAPAPSPPTTSAAPAAPTTTSPSPEAPPDSSPNIGSAGATDGDSATQAPLVVSRIEPVGLRIPALDVDAPVGPYGIDENRQMAVPDNVTEVGWYEFGPSPGESGSAVLAAHVDLYGQGPGVFFGLRTLEEGERVEVVYDDGSTAEFRVVARTVYDKDELPIPTIFSRQGPAVLTLITCGGGFSRSSRTYDSNVVVYAVPVAGDFVPGTGTAS